MAAVHPSTTIFSFVMIPCDGFYMIPSGVSSHDEEAKLMRIWLTWILSCSLSKTLR